jgi:hypothetical protein
VPMDFLRRIEHASFPLAIEDEADINCIAVLAAAHLVEAHLPPVSSSTNHLHGATVLRITPFGRAELRRLQDKPASAP